MDILGKSTRLIECLQCEKYVKARLITGKEAYPYCWQKKLRKMIFWACPNCGGFVGVHPGTKTPLGCIPTPEIKEARKLVHNLIDPIWKSGAMKRGEVYRRLSDAVGHPYHNGETRSLDELRIAYREGLKIKKELREKKALGMAGF